LFADTQSNHFKNLFFKVCQIPFANDQNDHQKTVVKFIQKYDNDNNPADQYGWTPLHTAAHNGDMLSVLLILQISQYKNPENEDGHLEVTRLLLHHCACHDNNPADQYGWTPLHTAAHNGDMLSVLLILQISQYKNPENEDGVTPLHWAAENGHLEVTRLLLHHCACQDKNPEDKNGKTRLHPAAQNGHLEVTRLLLQHFIVEATCWL
jgi:ankyrin repeat protein